MDINTEKTIIEKYAKDNSVFAKLYEEYMPHVFRYVYSMVHDKQKAEDITQNVFVVALEKMKGYKFMGISIKYWFLSIARNLTLKSFAKKKEIIDTEIFENVPDVTFVDQLLDKQYLEDINGALENLPIQVREVITLKIWEEYTFEQIANLMGISEGAVKMSFYRGVEKLKKTLTKKGYSKNLLVFPLLFTGLLRTSSFEQYIHSESLSNFISRYMNGNFFSKLPIRVKAIVSSMSLPAKVATVSVMTVVVVIGGYSVYNHYNPQVEEVKETVISKLPEEQEKEDEEIIIPEEPVEEIVVEEPVVEEPVTPVKPKPVIPVPEPAPIVPAPTTYEFIGTYITATVPVGWTLTEITESVYSGAGFWGIKVVNSSGTQVFSMTENIGSWGVFICDCTTYYWFSDEPPTLYDEINADVQASCGISVTKSPTALPISGNVSLLGAKLRRSGTKYYQDTQPDDGYFSVACPLSDWLAYTISGKDYLITFSGADSKLDALLNSVKFK